jgi:Right handed beta helix region
MPNVAPRALVVAAIALTLGATPAPSAAATVIRVPDVIDATGAADVTAPLNRFFASVPDGATVELADHGRYRSEGVLRLTGVRGVTIDGNGSEIFAQTDGRGVTPPAAGYRGHWPRLRQHIAVRGAHSLTVRDLSIRGANGDGQYVAALEGQAGVSIARSDNVVLDHVAISHTYGDGVGFSGAARAVTVRDSTFDTIGRQGIAVVSATDVVVERNHFQKIARSVFDIEAAPRSPVRSVHLRGNDVGDFTNFLLAEGGAGANVSDVWLENNRVTGGSGIAVFAGMPRWLRHGLHIIGNTSAVDGKQVRGTGRTGVMQIVQVDGVEIRGNRQHVASGVVAVGLVDVCNLTMRDNDFPGAASEKQQSGTCKPGGSRSAAAANAKKKKGSTDETWMIAGLLAGAAVLLVLGQQAVRKRVRART